MERRGMAQRAEMLTFILSNGFDIANEAFRAIQKLSS